MRRTSGGELAVPGDQEGLSPEAPARSDKRAEACPSGPIVGWMNAYRELGVSPDYGLKIRKEHGDRTRVAWWPSREALFAWFGRLIAPPEPAPKPPRKQAPRPALGAAIDPADTVRELISRKQA